MKRLIISGVAAITLFLGGLGLVDRLVSGDNAHAGPGHQVDVVTPTNGGSPYEVNPAPGDNTVDGWTWGS